MDTKPSKKLLWANYLVLAVVIIDFLLFACLASSYAAHVKPIYMQMGIPLPIPTKLFLGIPIWLYYAGPFIILALLVIKEFLCNINTRLLLNIIGLVFIHFIALLYILAIMMPILDISKALSKKRNSESYHNVIESERTR
jgi:hypothetical protein